MNKLGTLNGITVYTSEPSEYFDSTTSIAIGINVYSGRRWNNCDDKSFRICSLNDNEAVFHEILAAVTRREIVDKVYAYKKERAELDAQRKDNNSGIQCTDD